MLSTRQNKQAARSMTVGRPEHIIAAVEHGGILTLLGNHSVATKIFVTMLGDGSPEGVDSPMAFSLTCCLVSETRDVRTELARGPVAEMEAMRMLLAREVMSGLRRGRGYRRPLLMTVCGLLGMMAGAAFVLGVQPVSTAPGAMAVPASLGPAMAGMPAGMLPAARSGGVPLLQDPASRGPAADLSAPPAPRPGDASTPAAPVSLDDVPPLSLTAPPPPAPVPASAVRPEGTNLPGVPTAPLPPSPAALVPAPAPAAASPIVTPVPAAPLPAAVPAVQPQAAAPQAAATPAAPVISSQADAEQAQKTLAALKEMQADLAAGRPVPASVLAQLPPEITKRYAQFAAGTAPGVPDPAAPAMPVPPPTPLPSPAAAPPAPAAPGNPPAALPGPRLNSSSTGGPSHDRYGIPDVPDKGAWSMLGPIDIPLPGGGNIKSTGDMAAFGVK